MREGTALTIQFCALVSCWACLWTRRGTKALLISLGPRPEGPQSASNRKATHVVHLINCQSRPSIGIVSTAAAPCFLIGGFRSIHISTYTEHHRHLH
ncbi:hypothetical protein DER46DRAFT_347367 [Fusarium sp. MPI-SDFR-AT-0072]|nr:hypothetical protein DER46DRAFT_347367 [Fusarium sp. MPI-SDFR-AT-0072]